MEFSISGIMSREQVKNLIYSCLFDYENNLPSLYAIINSCDKKLLGYCGCFLFDDNGTIQTEISFRLDPENWGKGLATQAVEELIKYSFKKFNIQKIFAFVEPKNIGTIRVLEKAGFVFEEATKYKEKSVKKYILKNRIAGDKL